ncbi:hypothetical protein ACQR1V_28935 [Bradyrhizobium oligotrophicum]|uniref:hypothetical protein n=1 Tax=Bradyrhizobium oligotrophicum TaxID=44255 RepID=UPI003EB98217
MAATTIEFTPASAADECLAKPAGTPAGKHWFYRIDRATKKQCWYLRDDDREAKGASLVTRKLASQKERAQLSSTAANARAEIQSSSRDAADEVKVVSSTPTAAASVPATSAFPSVAAFPAAPPPVAAPAPVASAPAAGSPDPVGAAVNESAVATRWPDQSGTLQAAAEPGAPRASSYTLAAASDTSAAEAAAPATPALAAADASPAVTIGMSGDDASKTRMFAFLGAVAIAGFSISVLFARARGRRQLRIEPAAARRVTRWPAEPELDRMQLPPVDSYYPALAGRRGKSSQSTAQVSVVPRDDARYDEQYEVEDLLARYSGQERRNS